MIVYAVGNNRRVKYQLALLQILVAIQQTVDRSARYGWHLLCPFPALTKHVDPSNCHEIISTYFFRRVYKKTAHLGLGIRARPWVRRMMPKDSRAWLMAARSAIRNFSWDVMSTKFLRIWGGGFGHGLGCGGGCRRTPSRRGRQRDSQAPRGLRDRCSLPRHDSLHG